MKTGKTLVELATEIERQRDARRDFIAPTLKTQYEVIGVGFDSDKHDVGMALVGEAAGEAMPLNDYAHRQVGVHVSIPAPYYDRMREKAPGLLAANVNHWLHAVPEQRLVRTLDGHVRAFLSDRYRPLENADLAEAVLPIIGEKGFEIISCEVTERRLYIKAVDARVNRDIPSGRKMGDGSHTIFDTVSPIAVLSNSEVGAGALSIETGVMTRGCTNLAIFKQHSLRKYHSGARAALTEDVLAMLSAGTRRLTDAATWAQVRDVVAGAFDQVQFDARVDGMLGMEQQPIEGEVVKVVELAARQFAISEGERDSVLKHLITGGDLTRYGLFNAITRTAEDVASYDRATELERIGGDLIELPANDWKRIAEAA